MSRGILISIFRSFPCLIKGETEDAIEAGLVKELSASQGFSKIYLIDIHRPLSSLEVSYDQLVEYPPLSIQMMGETMEY